ncbi:YqaE/Pmp3 family membrane protein [Halotalea alkalilenta]|uniref:YqaE/Pmp3 family membrane protein n=1 Tax=Halotalea alkalilenta TaxID=376489 RepID=UPI000485AC94|nr:YqaE/Pmp3 family membrane protein [Halotalea alkalilenta]
MCFFFYVLDVILPPLSVYFQTGLSGTLLLNLALTLLGWVPGIIHALMVTGELC